MYQGCLCCRLRDAKLEELKVHVLSVTSTSNSMPTVAAMSAISKIAQSKELTVSAQHVTQASDSKRVPHNANRVRQQKWVTLVLATPALESPIGLFKLGKDRSDALKERTTSIQGGGPAQRFQEPCCWKDAM